MTTSPEPTWIPITGANKLLDACSDRQSALQDLDSMIARGGVRVRAIGITSLHSKTTGSSRQPSGAVAATTWATIRSSALDPIMWKTGAVLIPPTPLAAGFKLSGIRLERQPFLGVLAEYGSAQQLPAAGGPQTDPENASPAPVGTWAPADKGGKVKWKTRDKFWMALVSLAMDGKLNLKDMPSQAKLIAAIRAKVDDDPLYSERIIKKYVSDFYKEFIDSGR